MDPEATKSLDWKFHLKPFIYNYIYDLNQRHTNYEKRYENSTESFGLTDSVQ